jgi:ParB family chromosome partitioning protein
MTEAQTNGQSEIRMIDVSLIRPNDYNPYRMTKRQRRELAAEIKRLGTLPHPVILRLLAAAIEGKQYEIVDGEHRYLAAIDAGMEVIPCVILRVDEFEAMQQTYKRNRGGSDN